LRWPDRSRFDSEAAQQPGEFGLTQFVWRAIIVWPAIFTPLAILEFKQGPDQVRASDAVDSSHQEHGAGIGEQRYTNVLIRSVGAERDCRQTRFLAVPKIVGDGEKDSPVIRRTIAQHRWHFWILRERAGRCPPCDLLTRGHKLGAILIKTFKPRARTLHLDDERTVQQR
jgi:hypothetical protein